MSKYNKKQTAILEYLKYPWRKNNYIHKSSYMAVLIEARSSTKRNKRTGKKIKGDHGSWLGALGYMVLLDLIGSIFSDKTKKNNKIKSNSTFIKTLKYFTNLSDDVIYALYSLRCSFAHNFTLFNKNNQNPNLQHHFKVVSDSKSKLVILPKFKWDGIHKNKNGDNKTIVNLELLGDLVEDIHNIIIEITKIEIIVNND